MQLTHALLGFAVVVALLTVIPGLDTARVLRSSLTRSRGVAVATAAGIQTGTPARSLTRSAAPVAGKASR